MAQNYRSQSNRPESWRGGRYQTGSERDRYRTGGEQRFNPERDEHGHSRGFEGDRSYPQGGYSEEFGYQRGRNREDYNDRALGARNYGTRGASGANYQSGRSSGGEYDRQGQSPYDESRFNEGNRSEAAEDRDYGDRDLGGPEFTFARNRGTSTSRWREDLGEGGGYFDTGNYVDDGDAWRGFGRDFERARLRAQQENDFGSFRDENRETSGDYRNYGGSYYGAQSNYGRGQEEDMPWRGERRGGYGEGRGAYGDYEGRSGWDYGGGGRRAGYGSSGSAYGRYGTSSEYGPSEGAQSFRGRGPQGYKRSDERLKEMICERLTDDPTIDASNVTVEVKDQAVKLTGTVDDRGMKYEIEELIESCGGVKDIDNQLRVQSSQSSFGEASGTQSGQQTRGGSDWQAGSSSTSTSPTSGRGETRSASGTSTPSSGSTGRKG